jgi:hypothetical protein
VELLADSSTRQPRPRRGAARSAAEPNQGPATSAAISSAKRVSAFQSV